MLLLCYFIIRVDTILVVGARDPVWKHTSLVLFFVCFSISLSRAAFQLAMQASQGSIPGDGSHVLEAILLPYSKPRGSRSRHFSLIHELFFTVENISIFLSTIILNTKSYIVLLDTGLKSPECCIEL